VKVVILSKDSQNLIACAGAILEKEPEAKILVVDDGLDSRPNDSSCRFTYGSKPFVYSRNINIGIRCSLEAGGAGVLLLNDDALLSTPRGFSLLAATCAADPEIGIISATCNNVGNQNQLPQKVGLRFEPRMVCFVCVYIPNNTIEKVGLLDESFIGYGFEDDDYCLRVRLSGLKIAIHDGCYVDHASLQSSFRGPGKRVDMGQNDAIFRVKWGRGNKEL